MRKNLLVLVFLTLASFAKAQNPYACVDSNQIYPYYQCYQDYDPVCGCNGTTYRNACAAFHWGGLVNGIFQQGICGEFGFDFVPNPIVPGSIDSDKGVLSIYTTKPNVSVLIQIYDTFGRIWMNTPVTIYNPAPPIYKIDIRMDSEPPGIYYLFVIINGEPTSMKVMKANLHD